MVGEHQELVWTFAIVPVQEWIAEARRSRDLRAGSVFLSWAMGRLLASLGQDVDVSVPCVDRFDPSIAFADAFTRQSYSLPNRASGSAGSLHREELQRRLAALESVLDRCWIEWVEQAQRTPLVRGAGLGTFPANELPCPLNVVWALVDGDRLSEQTGVSADAHECLEQVFASVKRSRPAVRFAPGSAVGKCHQCGKREAVGPDNWLQWRALQARLVEDPDVVSGRRLGSGERLCRVCLIKRLAGYPGDAPFPSTHQIASAPWLELAQDQLSGDEDAARSLSSFLHAVGRFEPSDQGSDYLYSSTIDASLAQISSALKRRHGDDQLERRFEELCELRDRRARLSALLEHRDLPREPSDYGALLTFDADDMGAVIRQHRGLSWGDPAGEIPYQLSVFAKDVAELLPRWHAVAFYLGGDEGLLLAPVQTAIELAHKIRASWKARMTPGAEAGCLTGMSVGVAIFDRRRPLGAAIQNAHQAIGLAKATDGKDALTVRVETASGSSWSTTDRWGTSWDRVRSFVEESRLSAGWTYDVESLLRRIPGPSLDSSDTRRAVTAEMYRLTRRRAPAELGHAEWNRLGGDEGWDEALREATSRRALPDQLHLMAFLSRHDLRPTVNSEGVGDP